MRKMKQIFSQQKIYEKTFLQISQRKIEVIRRMWNVIEYSFLFLEHFVMNNK